MRSRVGFLEGGDVTSPHLLDTLAEHLRRSITRVPGVTPSSVETPHLPGPDQQPHLGMTARLNAAEACVDEG